MTKTNTKACRLLNKTLNKYQDINDLLVDLKSVFKNDKAFQNHLDRITKANDIIGQEIVTLLPG